MPRRHPADRLTYTEESRLRSRALDAEAENKRLRAEVESMGVALLEAKSAQFRAEARALALSRQVDAYRAGNNPKPGRVFRIIQGELRDIA